MSFYSCIKFFSYVSDHTYIQFIYTRVYTVHGGNLNSLDQSLKGRTPTTRSVVCMFPRCSVGGK